MQGRKYDALKTLHERYLEEAKKFLDALQKNAPQKELLIIRRNVRLLLQEIRRNISSASSTSQG